MAWGTWGLQVCPLESYHVSLSKLSEEVSLWLYRGVEFLQHLYPLVFFFFFEVSKDICTRVLRLLSHSRGEKLVSTHLLEEKVTTQDSFLVFGILQ